MEGIFAKRTSNKAVLWGWGYVAVMIQQISVQDEQWLILTIGTFHRFTGLILFPAKPSRSIFAKCVPK